MALTVCFLKRIQSDHCLLQKKEKETSVVCKVGKSISDQLKSGLFVMQAVGLHQWFSIFLIFKAPPLINFYEFSINWLRTMVVLAQLTPQWFSTSPMKLDHPQQLLHSTVKLSPSAWYWHSDTMKLLHTLPFSGCGRGAGALSSIKLSR